MPRAFLKIIAGDRAGQNVPLPETAPLVVGRKQGDLLLEDPLISGVHARIVPRDDKYVLQDVGSTNGTLVDGRLVREVVLRPGAEIVMGNVRMILFLGTDEEGQDSEDEDAGKHLEIAWLLDEELVEVGGASDRTGKPPDVIGQDLRLPPGMNAVLEVVAGQDAGKVFRFSRGNVTVGRRGGEIPLSDVEVSRRHAILEVFGRDMVFLRDLGSTNGTYHNGRRVAVGRLRDGDTIGVGRTVLQLRIGG